MARKAISTTLLLLAVVGPLLYGLSVVSQGVALMRLETVRLFVMFAVVSLSLGAGVYLAVNKLTSVYLRVAGVLSAVVTVGLLVWSWQIWAGEFRQVLVDTAMEPISSDRIGILFAPVDDSATATDIVRQVQNTVEIVLEKNGLDSEFEFRRVYPLSSQEQAERLATSMNANIVVWQRQISGVPVIHEWQITVMGADETLADLDSASLLRFLLTHTQLTIQTPREVCDDQELVMAVGQLASGFGALAAGDPVLAASEFHYAYKSDTLPLSAREAAKGYRGTALIYAGRPDLAVQEYADIDTAYAWTGQAVVSMSMRDWDGAQAHLQCAIASNPYYAPAYCGIGLVKARLLDTDGALAAYDEAMALRPRWGVPHALKAMVYELLGEAEAAEAEYQLCVQLSGPNGSLQRQADEYRTAVLANPPTAVPTATPMPTLTPTPFPTSGVHQVEFGDTLAGIADEYGVTIEDLVRVNDIDNPNSLSVGDVIVIPDF